MSRTDDPTCMAGVSRRLGFSSDAGSVRRWVRIGALRAEQPRRHCTIRITDGALRDFLRDERWWPEWDAGTIRDPELRAWARDLRAGVRFLTVDEVGRRLGYGGGVVAAWLVGGLLPAVRLGSSLGGWRIRESDVDAFTPPVREPRRRKSTARPRPPVWQLQLELAS